MSRNLGLGAMIEHPHSPLPPLKETSAREQQNQSLPIPPAITSQIQRELVDEHKDVIDTATAEAVNQEPDEQIRCHQAELKVVQEEMMQASKGKDKETMQELEEGTGKPQERVERVEVEIEPAWESTGPILMSGARMEIDPGKSARRVKRLQNRLDDSDDSCRCRCVVM